MYSLRSYYNNHHPEQETELHQHPQLRTHVSAFNLNCLLPCISDPSPDSDRNLVSCLSRHLYHPGAFLDMCCSLAIFKKSNLPFESLLI